MQACNKNMQISKIALGLDPHYRISVVMQLNAMLLH